jgi:hypothetical protein
VADRGTRRRPIRRPRERGRDPAIASGWPVQPWHRESGARRPWPARHAPVTGVGTRGERAVTAPFCELAGDDRRRPGEQDQGRTGPLGSLAGGSADRRQQQVRDRGRSRSPSSLVQPPLRVRCLLLRRTRRFRRCGDSCPRPRKKLVAGACRVCFLLFSTTKRRGGAPNRDLENPQVRASPERADL